VKPAQVRELSPDELKVKVGELSEQLFRLRIQKSIGQLDNALKIRSTRREIARIKTILREKAGSQPNTQRGPSTQRTER
jgi:large subunit ribosomal protein L29